MSAESSISNLINTLKGMSSSYRGEARGLVQKADDDLKAIRIPKVDRVEFAVERELVDLEKIPYPPELPGLDDLELPEPGELSPIDQLNDQFTGTAPSLASFTPSLLDLPDAPDFTEMTPTTPGRSLFPTIPRLSTHSSPRLTRPAAVTESPLSGNPPDIPLPSFTEFAGDVFAEYQDGLRLMGSDLQSWSTWLNALRADFSPVERLLIARLQKALTGQEPGLSETWENGQYTQAQQTINAERYLALRALDEGPSSITGLPIGTRVYQNLLVELKTLENTTQAAAAVAGTRHEQEVKHLQWALTTAARALETAMAIKGQEAVWRMTGAMLALEGANATLEVAEQVLAFKEKELGFLMRYNETQVRRTDDLLKIQLTHLEQLKLDEANNQLIAAYNENQAQIYRVAAGFIETRIKLYQAQLEYLAVDAESRKLELQAFEAEIQAYRAKANAHETLVAAIKAQIKGDLVQLDAELLKVDKYDGEVAAWAAMQQVEVSKIQAQIAQNKTVLEQYNVTLNSQLQYLRFVDRTTQSAVAAIIKRFDAESAEQQIKLTHQQLSDQEALFDAINAMKYQQADLQKELQLHEIGLQQSISQSQVINSGAATMGSIATQAFAGLNSVGAVEAVENA